MQNEVKAMEALAAAIADRVRDAKPSKPRLRIIITPQPTLFDAITRQSCITRIFYLSRAYNLGWLVDQSIFNIPGIDCLSDESISQLLSDMERARECSIDDVSFEDAGLIRNTTTDLPQFLEGS